MKTYTYTIQLEPAEEGGYVVSVPALPGCITQGETFDEAVAMAHDAIHCYIEGLLKDGEPIPEESQPAPALTLGVRVALPTAV